MAKGQLFSAPRGGSHGGPIYNLVHPRVSYSKPPKEGTQRDPVQTLEPPQLAPLKAELWLYSELPLDI